MSASARDAAADQAAVLAAERAICAAFEREDGAWLIEHLDPAFTLTNSRGVVTTREQEATELTSGKMVLDVFRNHDSEVRLYGDTAVVLGITSIKGSAEGEAFTADFRFTDVYVRKPKEWVLVASHASRLPPPEAAAK